jgi:hypothetical protein
VSLRDLCDVAYVLQVEQLERHAVAMLAAGAEVDPDGLRTEFDGALTAAPQPRKVMPERARLLMQAMGG